MWSTEEGKGKPLQYSCLENHEKYEKAKRYEQKDELARSVGAQYAPGEE